VDDTTTGDEYYKEERIRYIDFVYKPNIRTVQLHRSGWPLSSPVIELYANEKLKLSFDDLGAEVENYYYTLIHCSVDWQESNILQTDFINGFTDNQINDYQYSFNTTQDYTHYNLEIPNEDLKLIASGNYILKVYIEDNPSDIVLTKRFMVVEPKVEVIPRVGRASFVEDRNYKQEVDFTINHEAYNISDPYGDISIVITQNNRWDNAITGLKPLFIRDHELIYDHDEDNVFTAGNEFRNFDFKSFRYRTERVKGLSYDSSHHHVFLINDVRKSFLRYSTHSDINGRYFIKNQEGNNPDIDADYAFVHFTLPHEAPEINGNLYLGGMLTQWNMDRKSQLKYNYVKKAYEATLYVKQGYHEYQYIYLEDGKTAGDAAFIEGSHFDTENEYTIYVYDISMRWNFHKLIAVKKFASRY